VFNRLAKWVTSHPKKIIGFWIVCLLAASVFALKLPNVLTAGGFNDPRSESMEAQKVLEKNFSNQYSQQLLVVVKSSQYTVQDSQYASAVDKISGVIRQNQKVEDIESYYDHKNDAFLGKDTHHTFLLVGLNTSEDEAANFVPVLEQQLKSQVSELADFQWWVTGGPALSYALNDATKKDLTFAEMIAFPVMIVILLLVFRTVASTVLPLLMSAFALGITLAISYFIAKDHTMNILLQNAVSMIGLGVIVDYALFIISRYRQELERYNTVEAVQRAVATAGRAVFFSGATVAISLSSLFLPNIMIFNSIAVGGVIVVTLAVLVAVTLLPAILTLLGPRINWGRIPIFRNRDFSKGWHRFASLLMKRPVIFLIPAFMLLGGMVYPSYKLNMQVPVASASILPEADGARVGFEVLAGDFGQGDVFPVQIVLKAKQDKVFSEQNLDEIERLTTEIKNHPNVEKVLSLTSWNKDWKLSDYQQAYKSYDQLPDAVKDQLGKLVNHDRGDTTTLLVVSPKTDADSKESHELVKDIRKVLQTGAVDKFDTYVGGQSAIGVDFDQRIFDNLPTILVTVFVISFLVLVISFRSVLLPIKALILNSLVTLASMGMLVVFFQEGDFRGAINSITPVVLFAVLFGLSMDYEVLIISRIRELKDEGHATLDSIVQGISETAGLVNGAAAIMIAVFGAFAMVQVQVVKELGFGLAVAILLDATVIRSILVPAVMRLLGEANWWLPIRLSSGRLNKHKRSVDSREGLS
jgi:RND superfamily putative drug exporter